MSCVRSIGSPGHVERPVRLRAVVPRLLVATGMLLGAACESEPEEAAAPQPTVPPEAFDASDEVLLPTEPPHLVLGPTDSLPLDGRSGVLLEEGLAITNHGTQEVLLFDDAGALIARQGGEGYEPGAYINIAGIARHRDGFVVWDRFHLRLTHLDGAGRFVGETSVREDAPDPAGTGRLIGVTGDAALVSFHPSGYRGQSEEPVRVRQEVSFRVADLETGAVAELPSLPGEELWAMRRGRAHGGIPVVFGRTILMATTGQAAYFADIENDWIVAREPNGDSSRIVLEMQNVRADPEWAEIVRDSIMRSIEGMTGDTMILNDGSNFHSRMQDFKLALLEAGLPARSTLPRFSDMRGGADGRLWLREYPTPDADSVLWVGFGSTWSPEVRVRLPADLMVLDIEETRVLATTRAEGSEAVVVLSLSGAGSE